MTTDYTNSQTAVIDTVRGAAHPTESRLVSTRAEAAYFRLYGPRSRTVHVKATSSRDLPFHFSSEWLKFLRFGRNVTVFFRAGRAVGWLHHDALRIQLTPCPLGEGMDYAGELADMMFFSPDLAR